MARAWAYNYFDGRHWNIFTYFLINNCVSWLMFSVQLSTGCGLLYLKSDKWIWLYGRHFFVCVATDELRRSQRATPRVRRAPMAPPLTSPTRFRSTHRFIHSCFQRWRVAFLFAQNKATRHFRPPTGARYSARPFRPTGREMEIYTRWGCTELPIPPYRARSSIRYLLMYYNRRT